MPRPKGSKNIRAMRAQNAICHLLDDCANRVADKIVMILEEDPKEGIKLFTALLEFGVPKLQRMDIGGADGDNSININLNYPDGNKPSGN